MSQSPHHLLRHNKIRNNYKQYKNNQLLDTIPEEDAALQVVSILPGQQKVLPNMASIEEDRGDGVKVVYCILYCNCLTSIIITYDCHSYSLQFTILSNQ